MDGRLRRYYRLTPAGAATVGFTVLGPIFPVLTWLVGAAAVWLLWRPASGAFFKPPGLARAPRRGT